MFVDYIDWYYCSNLSRLWMSVDEDTMRNFWNSNIKGYNVDPDREFLENFKPFPKEWENIRQLILSGIDKHHYYHFREDTSDMDMNLGSPEDFDENNIELILDILDEKPEFGISKYVVDEDWSEVYLTNNIEDKGEVWVIPPSE